MGSVKKTSLKGGNFQISRRYMEDTDTQQDKIVAVCLGKANRRFRRKKSRFFLHKTPIY